MPKHVFFDLDNTLTPSRQPILSNHAELFIRLCKQKDVIAISGQELTSFENQLPKEARGLYYVLSQVGNHAYDKDGTTLWEEKPDAGQTAAVLKFISMLREKYPYNVKDENDIVELRGSLIGFSLIGHHENSQKKAELDPGSVKRKAMLAAFPEEVETLHKLGIDVSPAGTTTIEFFLAGRNKGFNIIRFIQLKNWRKEDCVYIGDELEEGRNDASVIGKISTHAVKDPNETFDYIAKHLLS